MIIMHVHGPTDGVILELGGSSTSNAAAPPCITFCAFDVAQLFDEFVLWNRQLA